MIYSIKDIKDEIDKDFNNPEIRSSFRHSIRTNEMLQQLIDVMIELKELKDKKK